jgi:hypothetical protein
MTLKRTWLSGLGFLLKWGLKINHSWDPFQHFLWFYDSYSNCKQNYLSGTPIPQKHIQYHFRSQKSQILALNFKVLYDCKG